MEKDIGKIAKNEATDIIVRIDDFGGRTGLTIREFVTGERYTGFTKSGVKILAANFPKFKEMINSISEEDMKEEAPSEETLPEGQKTLDEEAETSEEPKVPELPEREEQTEGEEISGAPPEPSEEEVKVEKPGEELPDY